MRSVTFPSKNRHFSEMFRSSIVIGRVAARAVRSCHSERPGKFTMRYTASHEFIKLDHEFDIGTVGITSFAADALGDVVFVDLPQLGAKFSAGDSFGSVESVKAASDVYSPVAGEVLEVNQVST